MSPAVTFREIIALAAVILCVAACGGGGDEVTTPTEDGPTEAAGAAEETADDPATGSETAPGATIAPLQRKPVTLFFASAFGDGLVPERAEIFATASPVDRAKQIVSDLISGPNESYALEVLPSGTRLRQIYVTPDGVAWADFTEDFRRAFGGGSRAELLAIYAVVDSLAMNIPEIQKVGFLVNGDPIRTLNGHIDLTRPLPPNRKIILSPPDGEDDGGRFV